MDSNTRIITHHHHVTLTALPADVEYFFSIRSPETRFVSGFYSRKRKGRPRCNSQWTSDEREAFLHFEHANDLAEALFTQGPRGWQAFAAMQAITHLATNQCAFFKYCGGFLADRPPLTIIRQQHFDRDIGVLFRKLRLATHPSMETDPVRIHKNDYTGVKPLSEQSRRSLRIWCAQDFKLYWHCSSWLESQT